MTFVLMYLVDGECLVFYSHKELDFYVNNHIAVTEDPEDFCIFKLPDDFCIPVRFLHHSVLISDMLATMGYDSQSLKEFYEQRNPSSF